MDAAALYPLISDIQTRKKEGKIAYYNMIDFETLYPSVSRPQLYKSRYMEESKQLYAIFIANLLRKLRNEFPNATSTGKSLPQWIGALAYVNDLCLCADRIEELNKMITVAHQ